MEVGSEAYFLLLRLTVPVSATAFAASPATSSASTSAATRTHASAFSGAPAAAAGAALNNRNSFLAELSDDVGLRLREPVREIDVLQLLQVQDGLRQGGQAFVAVQTEKLQIAEPFNFLGNLLQLVVLKI